MNKIKLFLAAGLFLALTAIKLISPQTAFEIKKNTLRFIDYNDSYTEVIKYIENLRSVEATPLPDDEDEPEIELLPVSGDTGEKYQIKTLKMRTEGKLPETSTQSLDNTDNETHESEPEVHEVPESVATFLASQEAFSDYDIPENATYDYLEIELPFASPVAGLSSSGFGYRVHPIYGDVRFHYGTDFAADSGTDVLAFASGTVIEAGYDTGYGNYVKIDHGAGCATLYAHCSSLLVSVGENVSVGQKIACVGATGLATGPHLHFELTNNGEYLNPEYYLGNV